MSGLRARELGANRFRDPPENSLFLISFYDFLISFYPGYDLLSNKWTMRPNGGQAPDTSGCKRTYVTLYYTACSSKVPFSIVSTSQIRNLEVTQFLKGPQ